MGPPARQYPSGGAGSADISQSGLANSFLIEGQVGRGPPSELGWAALFLTLLLSAHIALEESLWTVFAPKGYPLNQLSNRLIRMAGYIALASLLMCLVFVLGTMIKGVGA